MVTLNHMTIYFLCSGTCYMAQPSYKWTFDIWMRWRAVGPPCLWLITITHFLVKRLKHSKRSISWLLPRRWMQVQNSRPGFPMQTLATTVMPLIHAKILLFYIQKWIITSVEFNLSVMAWSLWWLGYGLDYRRVRVQFLAGARTSSILHSLQLGSGPHSPVMHFVPTALSLVLKRLTQFPFKHWDNITFSQPFSQ
jgi:preprotein translocase subunit SecY